MILKIKKDDFNWLYIETTCFEIQSTYEEFPPNNSELEPISLSYGDTKAQKFIVIERLPKEESINPPLKTFIFTDTTVVNCIGKLDGFVLNNKGQTVERL